MRQKPNKSLENGADFVRYDAILFDLDGTLTESEPGILNSVQYSLEQMSVRGFERRQLRAFIGPPLYEAFREIVGLDDQEAKRAIAIFRERFERVGWAENSVYTGIPRLLRSLKAAGAYVAVATSKPAKFAGRILEHFGLMGCIDRVCAVSLSENHAEKAELIRRALPGRFERAVMVGDRKFDMQGGRENGIEVIGALYGYGSREELLPYAPEGMAESVDELQNLLLGDEKPARGVFISLEGTDGCGKSTQIPLLQQWLERCGEVVCLTREPGGCPISERIREIILDVNHREMTDVCEAYLYAAARAQHVRQRICPPFKGAKSCCATGIWIPAWPIREPDGGWAWKRWRRSTGWPPKDCFRTLRCFMTWTPSGPWKGGARPARWTGWKWRKTALCAGRTRASRP